MPIPQSQLDTWANPGALISSSAAYTSIRNALLKSTSPVSNLGLEIFLQGSYANSTNIYGDSDVDVVVLDCGAFYKDVSALTSAQQQLHDAIFHDAPYTWHDLHAGVLRALRLHYGDSAVTPGRKSIKVVTADGRKPSDVVPAMQFRRYARFAGVNDLAAHWGIQFFDSSNNPIVNYPKYHIARGEDKNATARTGGRYKPTVRIFKNFRNYLINNRMLAEGTAPSYFIECSLYNAPDSLFAGNLADTIPALINYFLSVPYATLICQNGVVPLIGAGSSQWSAQDYSSFWLSARDGWNNF